MTKETIGGWIEEVPGVEIELLKNGNVRVTDKSDPNQDYSVDLHPIHLRLIAEKLGHAREMSASEADSLRTANKWARRIKLLAARIEHLGEYLALYSDSDHADLSYEQTYATATADLAEEFVREIEESGLVTTESRVTTTGAPPKPAGDPAGSQQAARAEQQMSLEVNHG